MLFAFCLSHFANHALGIFSLRAMDLGSQYHYAIWHNTLGLSVLALAAFTHVGLALWRTAKRRTFQMPIWEFLQLVLGLYIPWTLTPHVFATLGLYTAYGLSPTYERMLNMLWPEGALMQSILLIVVWTHAMIGLHFWLRLYPMYRRVRSFALAFAIGFPLLALWGWIEGARRQADKTYPSKVSDVHLSWLYDNAYQVLAIVYGLVILSILVVAFRIAASTLSKRIKVTYPGNTVLKSTVGPSLLEISRINGIPHAAVCGGRARCSTCRVLVKAGGEDLLPPEPSEAMVLNRIGAGQGVRLACQIRPKSDIEIQPLVPSQTKEAERGGSGDAYHWGVEQPVTIMFVDLRNFTGITETNLSFDVVFLLNRYLDGVSSVIRAEGGYVDKFIGDGIMAIFGMETGAETGAKQALRATIKIREVEDAINADRGPQFPERLRFGLGLHSGTAILGRIGSAGAEGQKTSITALGDVVNTASRLEAENKSGGTFMTVSEDVLRAAGIQMPGVVPSEIKLRGKTESLRFFSFHNVEGLAVPA
ncbi:adenylate cyclase [Roseibium hamelinense]|uniref:Adenylate cyclase n=1 Tax=Roseibium hamelinense TaxID=150831 RepID=A0A562SNN5_9HYPH|nr:adenylate cyclase [Roseibium hamelinense]